MVPIESKHFQECVSGCFFLACRQEASAEDEVPGNVGRPISKSAETDLRSLFVSALLEVGVCQTRKHRRGWVFGPDAFQTVSFGLIVPGSGGRTGDRVCQSERPVKAAIIEKRPGTINLTRFGQRGEDGGKEGGRLPYTGLAEIPVELPPGHETTVVFGACPGQTGLNTNLEGGFIVLGVETVFEHFEVIAPNLHTRSRDVYDLEVEVTALPQSRLNGQVDLEAREFSLLVIFGHAVLRMADHELA